MKNFNDFREKMKKEDIGAYTTLEISGKLIGLRLEKGITCRELSELSGVSLKTIYRIENGETSAQLSTYAKLAKALDAEIVVYTV